MTAGNASETAAHAPCGRCRVDPCYCRTIVDGDRVARAEQTGHGHTFGPGFTGHAGAPCDNPTCWEFLSSARAAHYDANRNHACDLGHYCSTGCYDEATGQVR